MDPHWFPDEDFRFTLGTTPGSAEEFFALSPEAPAGLAERAVWLRSDPNLYAALLPAGTAIAEEFLESVRTWRALQNAPSTLWSKETSPFDGMLWLSQYLEPDFVLLAPSIPDDGSPDVRFTVAGGCVCFPSTWRLTDKLGLSVAEVHEPVPGLNGVLESQIDRLLSRLKPGKCVVRANWSICHKSEFNQHPERRLPPVPDSPSLDDAWLRREDQCLFVLPQTRGVVFGIRVTHTSWRELRDYPDAARSVARGLRTMPADMRGYKRLSTVADDLARLLEN